MLADESAIQRANTRQKRIVECRNVARTYRELANNLRAKGIITLASGYRLRGERIETQGFLAQRKVLSWLGALILDLVSGYGERANRTFLAYITVVVSFAGIYYWLTHTVETKLANLSWDESLVLSLTSFHGRGFFPGSLPLGDWAARIGAIEAVIGLFIELILIATFSRRFLSN